MRKVVTVSLLTFALFASACSDMSAVTNMGETTQTATIAGGAMGAGLGAIVGSTTGDAGAGLAIGGIAGAASGAAIGNVLQGQEDAIRTQDEAIERQEQMIASQRSELDELRRLGQDSVSFRSPSSGSTSYRGGSDPRAAFAERPAPPTLRYESRAALRADNANSLSQGNGLANTQQFNHQNQPPEGYGRQPIREADLTEVAPVKGAYDWDAGKNLPTAQGQEFQAGGLGTARGATAATDNYGSPSNFENVQPIAQSGSAESSTAPSYSLKTPECNQAESEARQAESAEQTSDKLFHIRRALRLCPNEARYHNSLGQVYVSLNRTMDARFEFEQALALDPNLQAARENLQSIGKKQG